MKRGFYPKLAWMGIRKNKRLYTPYLLTCTGMVAMHYIVCYLSRTDALLSLTGGETIQSMMQMGSWIIALFAALFLIYSNSFLIRRRQREFGLYNILGMDKRNIGVVLFWETLITAVLSSGVGLVLGAALSKTAELGLANIMHGDVSYRLTLSLSGAAESLVVFGAIYALILIRSLFRLRKTSAIDLLHSESAGEQPPKANWFWGLLGALILAAAYGIAITIQDPLSAFVWFFIAVGMVILATYLLFQTGSVLLCRILQKNRSYYYRSNHFVSVSSMAYRMKRNGAGLASICILLTMVLVMLSSTSCLYFGAEEALFTRYPRQISADVYFEVQQEGDMEPMRQLVSQVAAEHGASLENVIDYRAATVTGMLTEGELETDYHALNVASLNVYGDVCTVHFIPLEDYNRMTGEQKELSRGEALIYSSRGDYGADTLNVRGGGEFRIRECLSDFPVRGDATSGVMAYLFVVVPDITRSLAPLIEMKEANGEAAPLVHWRYCFDLDVDEREQIRIYRELYDRASAAQNEGLPPMSMLSFDSRALNRDDFYGTFGGMFFLGLMLSVVFLFAAVLIIYYKQVSEGYEDQSRFEIMQKVGITKRDIRRSVNSQMLTVFFLPLLFAGMHLIFAFPMIRKLLVLFNMQNVSLFILTTLISFAVFGFFYALVYKITSNAYYNIVSGAKHE